MVALILGGIGALWAVVFKRGKIASRMALGGAAAFVVGILIVGVVGFPNLQYQLPSTTTPGTGGTLATKYQYVNAGFGGVAGLGGCGTSITPDGQTLSGTIQVNTTGVDFAVCEVQTNVKGEIVFNVTLQIVGTSSQQVTSYAVKLGSQPTFTPQGTVSGCTPGLSNVWVNRTGTGADNIIFNDGTNSGTGVLNEQQSPGTSKTFLVRTNLNNKVLACGATGQYPLTGVLVYSFVGPDIGTLNLSIQVTVSNCGAIAVGC